MTRDEKLEVMAREWCRINGWDADYTHVWLRFKQRDGAIGSGPLTREMENYVQPPIWTRYVETMDRSLKSINE